MKTLSVLIFLLICLNLHAVEAQTLDDFNRDRLTLTKKGMLVLGGWSVANLVTSPIFASNSSGNEKYFHQMNGYFNAVNLVIAGLGYRKARKSDPAGLTLSQSIKEQQRIEKALLFNTGLDLAYIAVGLYLVETGRTADSNAQLLQGFGQSLALQGSFLFAFDLVFYMLQKKNGNQLFPLIDGLALHPSGFQIVLKI